MVFWIKLSKRGDTNSKLSELDSRHIGLRWLAKKTDLEQHNILRSRPAPMAEKRQQRLGQERLVQFNCPEKKKKKKMLCCEPARKNKMAWKFQWQKINSAILQLWCFFFFLQSRRTHQKPESSRRGGIQEKKQQLSLAAKDERTQWTRPTKELP